MTQAPEILEHWYLALREPAGYCFRVISGESKAYRSRLYEARREAQDPQLATLSVIVSPSSPEDEIWIVHREAPNVTTENPSGQEEGDVELDGLELFPDG